jgi:hypothetical protein
MSDALADAESLIADLPGALSRRSLGERLTETVTKLRTADHLVERITSLIRIARQIEFGKSGHQKEALDDVTENAIDIGERLSAADSADALRSALYDYEVTLRDAVRRLETLVGDHWRGIVRTQFQPLQGVAELLTRMKVEQSLGARMTAFTTKALNSGQLAAAQLLSAIGELRTEFDALQAERAAAVGSDDVGEFINALSENRATLRFVTPAVLAWLIAHDALDEFDITPL